MNNKTDIPDSDRSARNAHAAADDLDTEGNTDLTLNAQTSNKTGKHSTVEKLSASRPEYGEGRGAVPVDGAFGYDEDKADHAVGRNASPGTNQFKCDGCGRFFNTEEELSTHAVECRAAKSSTAEGRTELLNESELS